MPVCDTCKYTGEICKYEDDAAEEVNTDTTLDTTVETTVGDAEEVVEEPSPAGSRRLKKLTRIVNFALHMLASNLCLGCAACIE